MIPKRHTLMRWKHVLAVLAYVIPSMVLGMLWHLQWFKQEYHDFGIYTRTNPIIPLGFSTMLIQGAVMVGIYSRWRRPDAHSILEGIRFALLIGVFLFSVSTLATIAKTEVAQPWRFVLLSGIFHTLQFVVSGAAIGFVFSRGDRKVS